MRPLVLSWSVLGLKHYTAGAGVGVMVKSVFVVPQRHKKLKRLGNVTVHTAAETGIIQSQRVIAWRHAVHLKFNFPLIPRWLAMYM